MKIFLLSAAVITSVTAVAAPAHAQAAWPVVYRETAVSVALDTAGATRNRDGSYLTRTRWDYARTHFLESKKPYTQMTEVALLKCTPVRIKRLTESFYDEGGAAVKEGSMPDPSEVQYMTWDRLALRSEGSRAFSNICSILTKRNKAKR
jgi:hypothetical protein